MAAQARTDSSQAPCPLCGSEDGRVVFDMRVPARPNDVPGLIVRCNQCPLWFKAIDSPDALTDAYDEDYGTAESADHYFDSDATRTLFQTILKEVAGRRPDGAPLRLLDIGTGPGALLEVALEMGFDAEGIDLCEPLVAKARARGLRVTHGQAEDLPAGTRFDVVTMLDVIEHVADPLAVMASVYRILEPGGRFVCYTPNHRALIVSLAKALHSVGIESPAQEIFGCNHVCFFDDHTLPAMLERAGFAVRACHLSTYDPRRPGTDVSRATLAGVTAIEWLGKPFGRVFRMAAYAEKPTPS